jgi:hypothetical protein
MTEEAPGPAPGDEPFPLLEDEDAAPPRAPAPAAASARVESPQQHVERLLDDALANTFPASDPVALPPERK